MIHPGSHATESLAGASACPTCRASTARSASRTTGRLQAGKVVSLVTAIPSVRLALRATPSLASVSASKCQPWVQNELYGL